MDTKLQQLKSSPDRCVQNAQIEECNLHASTIAECIDREVQINSIDDSKMRRSMGASCTDHYKEQRLLRDYYREYAQYRARKFD